MMHCSLECTTDAFYLTPLKKPLTTVWYSSVPVGHSTLSQTVKRLCGATGVQGFKTNHSLRVTAATRLFQQGADEQLIMKRTSHRSTKAYKRTSESQIKVVSDVLNQTEKKRKVESSVESSKSLGVTSLSQGKCSPY